MTDYRTIGALRDRLAEQISRQQLAEAAGQDDIAARYARLAEDTWGELARRAGYANAGAAAVWLGRHKHPHLEAGS